MNLLGKRRTPFVFLIDFEAGAPIVLLWDEVGDQLQWITPQHRNVPLPVTTANITQWEIAPVPYEVYRRGFNQVRKHLLRGDTYLLNYTQPTQVNTNLHLEEIFALSHAPYRIYLRDRFVCFSPETFVRIEDGMISSHPMKGTIDASLVNAKEILLRDRKETAEHHTIVDLIRNDLGLIADRVRVEKFRYIQRIETNRKTLLQVSSKITGVLPPDYHTRLGDLIFRLLPAGSVSGAPKPKTVEIIKAVEGYHRGYYTGVFGLFDGRNLDSAVLIRYIEKENERLVYKSGGGITFQSDCRTEYEEMINKVYVPIA